MDELVQKMMELMVGDLNNKPDDMKRITAEAIILCCGALPMVSSQQINDAFDKLLLDGLVDENIGSNHHTYQKPYYNKYLKQEGLYHIPVHEAIDSILKEKHPGVELVVKYDSGKYKKEKSGISNSLIFYSDEKRMREELSSKLTQTGQEGHYLFDATSLLI